MIPTVTKNVLRTTDAEYRERIALDEDWVQAYGIRLDDPTAALWEEARESARITCEESARQRGWVVTDRDEWDEDFVEDLAGGEVATALVARHLGLPHAFNRSGNPDVGGDIKVRPNFDLECKRRRWFLTLNGGEITLLKKKPAIRFVLLVQHRWPTSPWIFCGAIAPATVFDLIATRRQLELRRGGNKPRIYDYVTASELSLKPTQFAPKVLP